MTTLTENLIEINGVRQFYTTSGHGRPLILLHAGVSSHHMWDPFVPHLNQSHQVFALDMRGHGRSEMDERGISYPLLAADLAAFIEQMDLDRPHVVGYSSGANVALEFATHFPTHAASVTLGAAWLRLTPETRQAFRQIGCIEPGVVDFDLVHKQFSSLIERWIPEHSSIYGREHWRKLFEYMSEMDLTPHNNYGDALKAIKSPVLVCAADHDGLVPLEQTIELYELTPAAELLIVPGTNHFSILAKPAFLSAVILEFVDRH